MKAKVYEYANCSTCKKALKFLDERRVPYEKMAIVETPPTIKELEKMLGYLKNDLKKLFNTSGQVYREMKLNEKLPKLTVSEALQLLSKHGKLVKRPFLLTEHGGAVGFKEADWLKIL